MPPRIADIKDKSDRPRVRRREVEELEEELADGSSIMRQREPQRETLTDELETDVGEVKTVADEMQPKRRKFGSWSDRTPELAKIDLEEMGARPDMKSRSLADRFYSLQEAFSSGTQGWTQKSFDRKKSLQQKRSEKMQRIYQRIKSSFETADSWESTPHSSQKTESSVRTTQVVHGYELPRDYLDEVAMGAAPREEPPVHLVNPACHCFYCRTVLAPRIKRYPPRRQFPQLGDKDYLLDFPERHYGQPFMPFNEHVRPSPEYPGDTACVTVGPVVGLVTETTANILLEVSSFDEITVGLVPFGDIEGITARAVNEEEDQISLTISEPPKQHSLTKLVTADKPAVFQFTGLEPDTDYCVCVDVPVLNLTHAHLRTMPETMDSPLSMVLVAGNFTDLRDDFLVMSDGYRVNLQRQCHTPQDPDLWRIIYETQVTEEYSVVLHLGNNVIAGGAFKYKLKDWSSRYPLPTVLAGDAPYSVSSEHYRMPDNESFNAPSDPANQLFREVYRRTWTQRWTRHTLAMTANVMLPGELDIGSYTSISEGVSGKYNRPPDFDRMESITDRPPSVDRTESIATTDSGVTEYNPRNGYSQLQDFVRAGLTIFNDYQLPLLRGSSLVNPETTDYLLHFKMGEIGVISLDSRLAQTVFYTVRNHTEHIVLGAAQFKAFTGVLDSWTDITTLLVNVQQPLGDPASDWHAPFAEVETSTDCMVTALFNWKRAGSAGKERRVILLAPSHTVSAMTRISPQFATCCGTNDDPNRDIHQLVVGPVSENYGQFTSDGYLDGQNYNYGSYVYSWKIIADTRPSFVTLRFGASTIGTTVPAKSRRIDREFADTRPIEMRCIVLQADGTLLQHCQLLPPSRYGSADVGRFAQSLEAAKHNVGRSSVIHSAGVRRKEALKLPASLCAEFGFPSSAKSSVSGKATSSSSTWNQETSRRRHTTDLAILQ